MDFISNKEPQNRKMLSRIGVESVEDLFEAIPNEIKLPRPKHDEGLSEYEGLCHMEKLASKNSYSNFDNYLGAGAYEHHVPALVDAICSKSEFLTSYTPYQAEASQGFLQVMFEFQSAICALTDLDVANSSLYDAASACAEACLMALRLKTGRNRILISRSMHPHYRDVMKLYLSIPDVEVVEIPFLPNSCLDQSKLHASLNEDVAAIVVQYPNFFGVIDDIKKVSQDARKKGVLTIVCGNPIAYGLYASPGELGADIAVGDCQPLGIPLQFGGPYAGYMACRQELVRQMPGRIVGETIDAQQRRGYVLTLQTREQHIRREKATSNICTNQALAALASLVAMLWYGKKGLHKLALTNFQRAAYLREKLKSFTVQTKFDTSLCFNEFVVKFRKPLDEVVHKFRQHKIEPGINLGKYYPKLKEHLLICVTETKSKTDLDRFLSLL